MGHMSGHQHGVKRFERPLRILGRAIVTIGLVIFYGTVLSATIVSPPEALLKAGAIIAAAGCLWLIGLLLWPPGNKGRVTFEATLGFFCLPAALISMFAASGDELGLQVSWLIITIFLLPGAIGLIGQAARANRAGERWRNTSQDDG